MTYTRCGQEILRDGRHFADAYSQDAAETILQALNAAPVDRGDQRSLPLSAGPLFPDVRHRARREGDEMVCICGKRWPYNEDHP